MKIYYKKSDVGRLLLSQVGYIKARLALSPEQEIGRNAEQIGKPHKRLNGGEDIVILPIGDTLLRDIQFFGKHHLIQPVLKPQAAYVFV